MLKRNWKGILIVMILVMYAFTSGCQSPSASPQEEGKKEKEEAAEDGEKLLNLLIPNYYNDVEKKQWATVVDKFKEMNPGVEVKVETGDVQVESGSLPALLQSGVNTPDAILMNAGPGRVSILSEAELIQPINHLYERNNWQDQLRPFAYNLIAGDEEIYELPHMIDAIALYYNKEIFEKHNIEIPKTSEEFLAVLQSLADAGEEPITVGARNGYAIGWIFSVMLEAVVGTEKVEEIIYGDGKWNDPKVVEVAQMLADWVEKGFIPKESVTLTQADSSFKFLNKQAAIYSAGTYIITDLSEQNLENDVGYFMMPSFIDGKTAKPTGGIGQTWVIPTKAEDPELAEKWLNFIVSKEFSETVMNFPDYNFIPASKVSMDIQAAGNILNQAIEDVKEGSGYNPTVFIGTEAKEAYYQNLQGVVGGLISPQEAMDNIEAGAEKDRANGHKLNKK
ncbi:extracellular solute-binding protein [Bacillus sp. FJAT-50079]|uniref:ABC transporter substrate-binding protein n=1 Tax=Bacillus sp. FJAT-50079 TaxID=2833577 RepID=UPI001BC95F22|nr:extracellular solute-binding protein [Bacillus sp. FJAT-50079]MBS4208245.1 extracellular solute-binding protein [Bacillus sp. FJAT-50079]